MPEVTNGGEQAGPSLESKGLNFNYPGCGGDPIIKDLNFQLPPGSRCLLLGSNGAGKSTLLQVLGGKYMVSGDVKALGRSTFHDMALTCSGELTYLGSQWRQSVACAGSSVPITGDISAREMIYGVAGIDEARRDRVVKILDVDLDWNMMRVSDGQRRRVQICMGILKPYKVLLMDEITVDMDVVGRLDLLEFFKEECEQRGCAMVYATHIFDGLQGWITHLLHVEGGELKIFDVPKNIEGISEGQKLLNTAEKWLRAEREVAREKKKAEAANPVKKVKAPYFPSRHMSHYR